MSEQQPLLPAHNLSPNDASGSSPGYKATYRKYQTKTAHFLERPTLHKIVLLLIAVDAACVFTHLAYNFLLPTCPPPEDDTPEWLEVLAQISLAITTLFLVEIPLEIWALGLQYLNPFGAVPHAGLHLFDATIILSTFILEVFLRGREREVAGLLVVLRVWRLIKLVGGVAVGATEMEGQNSERLHETKRELEEVKTQLTETRMENSQLRARLGYSTTVSAVSIM